MQERAANIEIAFPTRGKHQRGQCVDSDANNRNPNNGAGPDLSRIVETTQCFPCNCADGDKQKNRVEQRRQYRAATKPVSFAFRRKSLGHHARSPREQKAEDIAQVVTGVGDQCERMSKEPKIASNNTYAVLSAMPTMNALLKFAGGCECPCS